MDVGILRVVVVVRVVGIVMVDGAVGMLVGILMGMLVGCVGEWRLVLGFVRWIRSLVWDLDGSVDKGRVCCGVCGGYFFVIEDWKGGSDDVPLETKVCLRYSHVELGLWMFGFALGEPSLARSYDGRGKVSMMLLLFLMQGQEAIKVGLRRGRRSELSWYP